VRQVLMTTNDFSDRVLLRGFEGGAIYTAERAGRFYVIEDEGTMADLLSDDDLTDLAGELITVWEFDTPAARAAYIQDRGFNKSGGES